jgi:hypothetical protein
MGTEETKPSRQQLKFRQLSGAYAIVRLAPGAAIPEWAAPGNFTSIVRTADELSIVCAAGVAKDVVPGLQWTCLKLEGPFPFSQTGVLLSFIEPLSNNGVPIFAVATYDTDYILSRKNTPTKHLTCCARQGTSCFSD